MQGQCGACGRVKRRIVLITPMPVLVLRFLQDAADRLNRLEVSVPLVIKIYPSMRFTDRIHDLRRNIRLQARINQVSETAQLIHHFGYRWFNRSSRKASFESSIEQLREVCRVVEVESANDQDAVTAIREGNFEFGILLKADQLSRRTLDVVGLPLFNIHYSDPAFVRGRPPVFWEILDNRDHITITLHRVSLQLDAGAIVLQYDVPIVWRRTLRETMRATLQHARGVVIETLMTGIEKLCDGSAEFRLAEPGPLRTTPTISQVLQAEAICRRRFARANR